MRVLFADFDGVTLPGPFLRGLFAAAREFEHEVNVDLMDPYKIDLLNRLADVPGLHLVISSSWRGHENMPGAFTGQGVRIPLHPDWRTTADVPVLRPGQPSGQARGWQIDEWRSRNPGIEGYAIVDDESIALPGQARNFVQTSTEEGLMPRHIEELRRILLRPLRQRDRPSPAAATATAP